MTEENETPDFSKPPDTDEDIDEETGEDIEAEVAAETEAEEAPEADDDADNEPDADSDGGDLVTDEAGAELDKTDEPDEPSEPEPVEPDEEPLTAAENPNDILQADEEAGADADTGTDVEPETEPDAKPVTELDAELDAVSPDTGDHALATAIAETAEAFNEIDVALAADSAEEQVASKNTNRENNETDENEGTNET